VRGCEAHTEPREACALCGRWTLPDYVPLRPAMVQRPICALTGSAESEAVRNIGLMPGPLY